jgi:hypothetical protein
MKLPLLLLSVLVTVPAVAQSTADNVVKILTGSCTSCHSGANAAGKLRLDTLDNIAQGGASGPVVVAGESGESPLLKRVTTADRALRMPPTGAALSSDSIQALKSWIDGGAQGLPALQAAVDFEKDIEPVLQKNCFACHSGSQPKSQLRLDSKAGILRGGLGGPVIVPGNSADSRLVHRIEGAGGEQRMPLKGTPLTSSEIALIRTWIDRGATLPARTETSGAETAVEKHWAYRKPVRPPVPSVKNRDAVRNPIDAFLLSKLESQGLGFSKPATKEALIRRVSLDLIGLPPTPAEVAEFVQDQRPDAYERLVDRLLSSPHYGERWARHWLDLARYADTNGYEADARRTMWKYRDWVIDALNRDEPFDQFTVEQIAGDMLPNPTEAQKIATGFHRNTMFNEEGGVDKDESYFEVLVDRVNTTSTVWLGSTLACAQCHNHKYDPFTHKDYYRMMAFFSNNTKEEEKNGGTSLKYREPQLDLATADQETKRRELRANIKRLEDKLKTPTPELEAEQAAWEQTVLKAESDWETLQPARMQTESGTELKAGNDGVVVAAGENPQRETYIIEAPLTGKKFTGLRLKALPDASLPRGGPGRDVYGNFIVTDVRIDIGSGGQWKPVELERVVSDNGRIRPKGTNQLWTIDASREDRRLPRQLVVVAKDPLALTPGSHVRVTIVQNSEFIGQSIGRLQLSATAATDPTIAVKLTAKLRPILEAKAENRSADDSKEMSEFFRSIAPSLETARDQLREAKDELQRLGIVTALVMEEQSGSDRPFDYVRIRGGFASKGEKVYAGVPAALGTLAKGDPPNRLGLARWLVSRENPLTARVAVNRIWESYFGHGIVETSEDFGSQGEKPVNPELLDWLAVEFMDRGWSLKTMHRLITTSTAYRQSSKVTPELLEADPYNRLISRGPRFRLEAEMVRDVALSASGLLSSKIGGPSVFPPQPPGVWDLPYNDDSWQESKGEDKYRRGIYTFIRRSALYPAMMNFDAKSREICVVRRIRTNSPLAALTTLNDAAYFEMAQALARRMLAEGGESDSSRVGYGLRLVASRDPKPEEREQLLTWLQGEKNYFSSHAGEAAKLTGAKDNPNLASWTMLANVLLNLDEALNKE